ncbi:major capsid protein [Clostridium botulinum]|nr:major capsid protein [Clostridium botulinum]
MGLYDTKTMLQAIEQKKPVFTFLRDTFFSEIETLLTEKAEVDVKKGKRKLAPFVAPRVGGIILDRDGFNTDTITTPKIAPERVITIDDINKRTMGENVYSTRTPDERARIMLANDLVELDEAITRREEWMCSKILTEGSLDIEVDGAEYKVDYNFTNLITLKAAEKWTMENYLKADNTKVNPYKDLEKWRKSIIKSSGMTPNICILADDVVDAFIESPDIQKMLDIQRLNIGVIEPSYKGQGVTFIGKLPGLGLELYSYTEYYLDEKENDTPIIPSGKVLMGSTGMGKRYYGAVTQKENGAWSTYEGIRVPKYMSDDKNEIDKLRLTSRPLPAPKDADSWLVATVL